MKLTQKQIDTLVNLYEDKKWSLPTTNAHGNTLNTLFAEGLIDVRRYANGEFCEITTKGIDELNAVRPL
ncbi:MAG: hypothetical protein EHM34_03385 [Nitrosopumilales archaeon]|nr:MAG: hypothetical protein EHM34_03385 [Nitrosopumilales archaeon]